MVIWFQKMCSSADGTLRCGGLLETGVHDLIEALCAFDSHLIRLGGSGMAKRDLMTETVIRTWRARYIGSHIPSDFSNWYDNANQVGSHALTAPPTLKTLPVSSGRHLSGTSDPYSDPQHTTVRVDRQMCCRFFTK